MDLYTILQHVQSPDPLVQKQSEALLNDAQQSNFPAYVTQLAAELVNEHRDENSRTLAGLILKNCLDARDELRQSELAIQWRQLPLTTKTSIKDMSMQTLSSSALNPRRQAAQVISKIALIELPHLEWPDLIDRIVKYVTTSGPAEIRQSSLETLGYICEDIDSEILKADANQILTAIISGMRSAEPVDQVRITATRALINALNFVEDNFDTKNERDVIMSVVCECIQSPNTDLRKDALACVATIAEIYYSKLTDYMIVLYNLTCNLIQSDQNQDVVVMAIEFWSTLCESEIEIQSNPNDQTVCANYIKNALPALTPMLLSKITQLPQLDEDDDDDDEEWTPQCAATVCLGLVANTVSDEVVAHVLPFVSQNIVNPDWHYRAGAIIAFTKILEGPSSESLAPLVTQAIPMMLHLLKDSNITVRENTAWCLARILEYHAHMVSNFFDSVAMGLDASLLDRPRVAENICDAVKFLADGVGNGDFDPNLEEDSNGNAVTNRLSPGFAKIIEDLLVVSERADSSMCHLRAAAYVAIEAVIGAAAADTFPLIEKLLPHLLNKMNLTFERQMLSQDDVEQNHNLQANLCASLHSICTKLVNSLPDPVVDQMMAIFLQLFHGRNAVVHEEALFCISAVANGLEKRFSKYVRNTLEVAVVGIKNCEEFHVCQAAIGLIGDVTRATEADIFLYCDVIVSQLLENLRNPMLNRDVKPPIFSLLGDIALAIGTDYRKYLEHVMAICRSASQAITELEDPDMEEYSNKLWESIFDAYTGVVQGMKTSSNPQLLQPFIVQIYEFANFIVSKHQHLYVETIKAAVGTFGDLAMSFPSLVMESQAVTVLINAALESDESADIAGWARRQISIALKK